jgi:hypoxanthine-DNA glycosylase
VCSFAPIAAPDARVLVLGTVPSIASLAKRQYYGHPQNAFWPIMGQLFGADRELPYDERQRIVCQHGVAIWDVFRECYREGSLDASIEIESEEPNDFATFFQTHPKIHTVFFNGAKAETAFKRHVTPIVAQLGRDLRFVRLPSTSPAHAGRNIKEKLKAWRALSRAAAAAGTTKNTKSTKNKTV